MALKLIYTIYIYLENCFLETLSYPNSCSKSETLVCFRGFHMCTLDMRGNWILATAVKSYALIF